MKRILEKNKEAVWHTIGGELVLLNPISGYFFGLNPVAGAFWSLVDGKKSMEDILDILFKEYDVRLDVLTRDIEEITQKMEKNGLLILKTEAENESE
ncbi:MAG: PqqD family protein [Atribacterota bacterium]|nr:PqqD family protein [Candidatus Atribacteria bacterium]